MTRRIWLIKKNTAEQNGKMHSSFDVDQEIWDDYLNDIITKTICEAKNINQLNKANDIC